MPRILIVITSCHKNWEHRKAIRETWLTRLPLGMSYCFVVGTGPRIDEPNIIQLDVADHYGALPMKSYLAFRLVLVRYGFDWLMKVDDDTFLVPERLSSVFFDKRAEYIGSDCCYEEGYATGGAGYLLTRARVAQLAIAQPPVDWIEGEDGWVGMQMRRLGCPLYWTPLLHHSNRDHIDRDLRPTQFNNYVTGHYLKPEAMREMHAQFYGPGPF